MHKFHIKHINAQGESVEYDGLFECAIDAIADCIKTFGFGRVKVNPLDCVAANSENLRRA